MTNRESLIQQEVEVIKRVCAENPNEVTVFIDSCGPALARHYIFLKALEPYSFESFREIHCVSGGVFAFVGHHAFRTNQTAHALEKYLEQFDQDYRRLHHPNQTQIFRHLFRLMTGKPVFGNGSVLDKTLEYCFAPQLLNTPIQKFPKRFHAYLGLRGSSEIQIIRVGDPNEQRQMTMQELLKAAIRIPAVYGKPTEETPYYDGAFHPQYRRVLKNLENDGHRLLVSTPWRHGSRKSSTFVNLFAKGDPKFRMGVDFLKLVLNLPNKTYEQDLKTAFQNQNPGNSHS